MGHFYKSNPWQIKSERNSEGGAPSPRRGEVASKKENGEVAGKRSGPMVPWAAALSKEHVCLLRDRNVSTSAIEVA